MKFYQIMLASLVVLGGISLTGCGQQTIVSQKVPLVSDVSSTVEETPTIRQDVMKEWKTYRNEELGIEVQYPAGLKREGSSTSSAKLIFNINEDGSTNLREAFIDGEFTKVSKEVCLKGYNELQNYHSPEQSSPIVSTGKQDGIMWYKTDLLEAGVGNRYRTITYTIPLAKNCYSASLVLHSVERMNYAEDQRPVEYDPTPFIDTFEKMIARVKFLK
jgi:hypothetical protein